ncbi:UDP-2,3-diacylglucosamine diphosphatase [Marinoscillum sp. MHG1-6]|uniref:UDP-2,3-diacylglucosamine diphosphatase n=1 Tax=Marinoscillum sp. MHG1-6 TaxID=2959627 RepID=UPI002157A9BD|nr:UDP-2,3-diacylglucosamine diphosphatase [Marinoscillum sp. MHG1-6]
MIEQFSKIPKDKKVFIASDFHLTGVPSDMESERESLAVRWLEMIKEDAAAIILAGDVFDFWFEYQTVVPKGAIRLIGKLAEIADYGIPIIFFKGNHDLWLKEYFEKEIGAIIYGSPQSFQVGNQKIMIGHGDGLGPGDRKFKMIKKVFTFGLNKWLFRWMHPDIGMKLGRYWSKKSWTKNMSRPDPYLGEREPLYLWCKEKESTEHHDYYIFGHRHLQYEMPINETAKYINLGDWLNDRTYVAIDSTEVKVLKIED